MEISALVREMTTNLMDRMEILFVAVEFHAVIVDELGCLLVLVRLAHETGEEDRQANNLSETSDFPRLLSNGDRE